MSNVIIQSIEFRRGHSVPLIQDKAKNKKQKTHPKKKGESNGKQR